MSYTINVNGESRTVEVEADTPLLWVLRDELELKGSKFGCGMGLFAIAMARLAGSGGKVICADVQPRMLATLEKRARKAGVAERIRTHLCPPDRLGLAEPIDFALAFWSAHETRNLHELLDEIHACLVPGGRFLLVEPRGHVTGSDFAEMIRLARQVGFDLRDDPPRVRLSHAAVLAK